LRGFFYCIISLYLPLFFLSVSFSFSLPTSALMVALRAVLAPALALAAAVVAGAAAESPAGGEVVDFAALGREAEDGVQLAAVAEQARSVPRGRALARRGGLLLMWRFIFLFFFFFYFFFFFFFFLVSWAAW
jgi:hypothetical protein